MAYSAGIDISRDLCGRTVASLACAPRASNLISGVGCRVDTDVRFVDVLSSCILNNSSFRISESQQPGVANRAATVPAAVFANPARTVDSESATCTTRRGRPKRQPLSFVACRHRLRFCGASPAPRSSPWVMLRPASSLPPLVPARTLCISSARPRRSTESGLGGSLVVARRQSWGAHAADGGTGERQRRFAFRGL